MVGDGVLWLAKIAVNLGFIKRVIHRNRALAIGAVKPLAKSDVNTATVNVVGLIRVKNNMPIFYGFFYFAVAVDA